MLVCEGCENENGLQRIVAKENVGCEWIWRFCGEDKAEGENESGVMD